MGIVLTMALLAPNEAKKMTKTKIDYRIVRSPTHHTETTSAYVLSNTEEKAHANHQVALLSEAQYEVLLKQAQKALQGYDLSKLAAAVETKAVPEAPEQGNIH